jgi:hypothetical protein
VIAIIASGTTSISLSRANAAPLSLATLLTVIGQSVIAPLMFLVMSVTKF